MLEKQTVGMSNEEAEEIIMSELQEIGLSSVDAEMFIIGFNESEVEKSIRENFEWDGDVLILNYTNKFHDELLKELATSKQMDYLSIQIDPSTDDYFGTKYEQSEDDQAYHDIIYPQLKKATNTYLFTNKKTFVHIKGYGNSLARVKYCISVFIKNRNSYDDGSGEALVFFLEGNMAKEFARLDPTDLSGLAGLLVDASGRKA